MSFSWCSRAVEPGTGGSRFSRMDGR
jgi:ribosomal protein L24E